MTYYTIHVQGAIRKRWDAVRAETLGEATREAIRQVWGGKARMYRQVRLAPGKWRITVQLWDTANRAYYETLIMQKQTARDVQHTASETPKHGPDTLYAPAEYPDN